MALNYECEMMKFYKENKENPCKFFKMAVILLTLASLDDYITLAKYSKLCDLFAELTRKVVEGE